MMRGFKCWEAERTRGHVAAHEKETPREATKKGKAKAAWLSIEAGLL